MKVLMFIMALVLMTTNCFANQELIDEQQELIKRYNEYQVVMENIKTRLIEIQGILKYIDESDN